VAGELSIELDEERRRSFRRFLGVSAALHVALAGALAFSPSFGRIEAPAGVISVDLVALPGQPAAPRPKPAAKPAPAPKQAAPEPVAKPRPKPPVPEKRVLPQEAPTPKPKPQAKPKRTELPPEAVQRREEPEQDYGDVLEALRAEAGEEAPSPAPAAETAPTAAPARAPAGGGGTGRPVSPEVADWMRRARIHVRQSWVVPPGFRQQSLSTAVVIELDSAGNVVGEPEVVRASGNPWYDDGVVRSIRKASPLPAPPESGAWDFVFVSDE
jgi:protein TonB